MKKLLLLLCTFLCVFSMVAIANALPIAVFDDSDIFPNPTFVNYPTIFDGTGSYDTEASLGRFIVSYEWDVHNDGVYDLFGPTPTYSFPAIGNYTVVLRVTNELGQTDTDFATVHVVTNSVPEPATLLLLGSGLVGLVGFRRKSKK